LILPLGLVTPERLELSTH